MSALHRLLPDDPLVILVQLLLVWWLYRWMRPPASSWRRMGRPLSTGRGGAS